jgi:thymidylate kinase
MIIEGVGGAGKTRACAIQIVEDIPESEIWTAAPTDIQLDNLNRAIQKNPSRSFDRNQLMDEVLENIKEYNSSIQNSILTKKEGDKNFRKTADNFYIETGNLKVKQSKNKPRVLVIDEAT